MDALGLDNHLMQTRKTILGGVVLLAPLISGSALGAEPLGTVTPLPQYSLMGHAYQPVGNWTGPHTLEITFNAPEEANQGAYPDSIRYDLKGDVITLHYKNAPLKSVKSAGGKDCGAYATLHYRVTDISPGHYQVGIVADRTYAPVPLDTLQEAKAAGVPETLDIEVRKDGVILVGGKPSDFDSLDLLFTKAEPYQTRVNIDSDNAKALRVWSLAEEHQLPYSFPNLDTLLEGPTDVSMFAPSPASGAAPKAWTPFGVRSHLPLTVKLAIRSVEVDKGSKPGFIIEVRNDGGVPIRVLDIGKANSMYLSLHLTRDGKQVRDIPVFIDDPGPLGPDEFMLLGPGQTIHRETDGFPLALDRLPMGPYQAEITYYLDGMKTLRYIESNAVTFNVIP